ncbi:alanine dehydrogenase [Algoriphagus ornithinivorans]|jgi:alanine dehydrogenase|uniref:alanine dehydrogenase n=2 Tax=Algoriphagus TaxID=246875 RepID=A0A1I5HTA1_9BACT|nr:MULTISPECIES: alanine dehydrogenase [Algoriphagus]MAL15150.1 alanine dehydrogenase [Algoriphagus sp.]QYH37779.1 alanine dehydrogenase [Algoriphagus sp. NBT04N3]SFO51487.1 alanine dehydrogenase [Algoriphagus ornithinivorans]HCH43989.1 alanine dehydrogenase [Algoriphagus sp.]|tara:strand:- start:7505 stop:8716 length:1212 start_codon:yes stop_codon:yes gene_type:complete
MSTQINELTAVGLIPKESPAKVKRGKGGLTIGIPKEQSDEEKRIVLTPEAVGLLTNNGLNVIVESGAGLASKFSDQDFSDAGAKVVYSSKEAFQSEVVLKVDAPSLTEIESMNQGACLISALQIGKQNKEFIEALNAKKITSVAFEYLEDKVGGMPVVRAMSEIAGSTVMLIASEYLSSVNDGKGLIMGGVTGVPPTQVVIIGAGTVAEYAARTALGLGANIKIFDNHIYKLRRLKQLLGQQVYTSTIDNLTLTQALAEADVVIGALRAEKGRNKVVVSEEMVANMMHGSIIIDVGIDQGGCIETAQMTTHSDPVYLKHDIIHYCVPNIASRVSRTASYSLSNIFTPIVLQMADLGGAEEMIFNYRWFLRGVYTYRGSLTNAYLARKFDLTHKELQLLLAARY